MIWRSDVCKIKRYLLSFSSCTLQVFLGEDRSDWNYKSIWLIKLYRRSFRLKRYKDNKLPHLGLFQCKWYTSLEAYSSTRRVVTPLIDLQASVSIYRLHLGMIMDFWLNNTQTCSKQTSRDTLPASLREEAVFAHAQPQPPQTKLTGCSELSDSVPDPFGKPFQTHVQKFCNFHFHCSKYVFVKRCLFIIKHGKKQIINWSHTKRSWKKSKEAASSRVTKKTG